MKPVRCNMPLVSNDSQIKSHSYSVNDPRSTTSLYLYICCDTVGPLFPVIRVVHPDNRPEPELGGDIPDAVIDVAAMRLAVSQSVLNQRGGTDPDTNEVHPLRT